MIMGLGGGDKIRKEIDKLFDGQTHSKHLHLEKMGIDVKVMEYLCIKMKIKVTHVNLNRNYLGDEGLIILANNHEKFINLVVLGISKGKFNQASNYIMSEGMLAFGSKKWQKLTAIHLNDNMIGNKGVKYLTRCITSNLEDLCLDRNGIQDQGVFHLVKAPLQNIRKLSLQSNSFSKRSAKRLPKCSFKLLKQFFICFQQQSQKKFVSDDLLKLDCPRMQDLILYLNPMAEQLNKRIDLFYEKYPKLLTFNMSVYYASACES